MIEHIRVQNFKSLRDVSVELPAVSVLIGRSGTGKSNFLRAIRFLRNFLLIGDAAVNLEGQWPQIYPFGVPAPLSFSVRFRLPGYDEAFNYNIAWEFQDPHGRQGLPHVASEHLELGQRDIFGWTLPGGWSTWPGPGGSPRPEPRSYLGAFPTITEAVLAYTAWTSGIGWHHFPANVFVGPQDPSHNQLNLKGLRDFASNYLEVVREITQDLRDQQSRRHLLARAQRVNPGITAIELDSVLSPTKVIVTHPVGGQMVGLDLSQESDGFRRFYAHLLALYQTPPKLLLMFEEPENGIYPGALSNLAEEFKRSHDAGHGQVLLSTHSPQLLDGGIPPESLRVVDLDQQQTTRIAPLDPAQLDAVKADLLSPGELLTVTSPLSAAVAGAN